jgi:hypothetical protein
MLLALACPLAGCTKIRAQLAKFRDKSSSTTGAAPAKRPSSDLVAETIYDGGLKPGWQDWGWGTHDLAHGAASIDFSNYGGWILWNDHFPSGLEGFVFQLSAPASFGSFLEVRLAHQKNADAFPAINVEPHRTRALPGGWVEVYLGWSELNPSNLPVDQLTLRAHAAVGNERVKLDKLVLTAHDPNAKPAGPIKTDRVELGVDCSAAGRPISPYIYGIGGAGEPWDLGPTARRAGGNRSTRYNWQLYVTNAGKDWFFENTKEGDYHEFLDGNRKHDVFGAFTMPLIGWVAKDGSSSGFPVSKLGPQQATDGWRPDAGNGNDKDGKPIRPGPPTETSVPAEPAFVQKWVEAIVADDRKQGKRSIQMYILDNEPALWNANHRDIHPDPVSYDELLDRTLRYGAAIRAADPQSLIAGPAEWGWPAYFYSAKDLEFGTTLRPDRRAHGDMPLIPWYLKELRERERTSGTRVLDVLDVHYYPQGANVYGAAADAVTAALRIRSTRSLWDPTYKDESWINDTVRLIPMLKEWVAQYYPGRAISIGEYSFGGEQHASGAIAQAEALGRFGTEGVDYAFYWTFPPKDSPSYWAFRAYRNFDGEGGRFLDHSLVTRMAPGVSLFASRDASSKHLVLIAVNQQPDVAKQAAIRLSGCAPVESIRKFAYTPDAKALKADGIVTGAIDVLLAPYSITVFDIRLK